MSKLKNHVENIVNCKETLLNIWRMSNISESEYEYLTTYYEGEQTIILIRVKKDIFNTDGEAFVGILKKFIYEDNEWEYNSVDINDELVLSDFYDRWILGYLKDYRISSFNNEKYYERVSFDYDNCRRTYNEYMDLSRQTRKAIKKYIFNSRIINGVTLIDVWNEYELFIETDDSYLIYHWNTSA